jgi:predicted ATPase
MYTLNNTAYMYITGRDYVPATTQLNEAVALADEKGAVLWKALAMLSRGCVLALTGNAADAIPIINSEFSAAQSTGTTVFAPFCLAHLATAHAQIGQFADARRFMGETMTVMEATKELWFEAEVHRMAGEIALKSLKSDAAKVEAHFESALAVARKQQAKFLELRAAMSMARLWRDQGKPQQARELLAPVYGWFTEGFDTLDLKEAKALLDELRV